jgi:hypothetical protein
MTKQRKVNHNFEIFETFKQVRINIPLLDAIKHVTFYAKFFKDLCTVKRKLNAKKKADTVQPCDTIQIRSDSDFGLKSATFQVYGNSYNSPTIESS